MTRTGHHPRIGIGVFVLRDNTVLVGKRLHAHGADTWGLPGGHLEFGESVADCAAREVREETGLVISEVVPAPYTEDIFHDEHKHYITLFVVAHWVGGEAVCCEPDKCAAWEWRTWDHLPEPLFLPLQQLVGSGYCPFDT